MRSTMPRARNRPCMQYSLSTRLQYPIVPRQMIKTLLERGRVSRAKKSARMAKCALDLQDLRSATSLFDERLR